MSSITPGATIGRYRIERLLGQGAMGSVYLASDPQIERRVAIKIVRAEGAEFEERRHEAESRFLKEARIAGRLQHPNIVTIFDVGRHGDTSFIAMEYVEGAPLSRFMRADRPLTDAQRLMILTEVAAALAHAHARGVIHRDVKPANILVRADGVVKVSDFGVGKILEASTSGLTRTGQMIGSPSYMSPEQVRGETVDGRSDIFSFGVLAYELFTGERPFPAESISSLVYQILNATPRDPRAARPDIPEPVAAVIRRCLAKDASGRYADAAELLADLRRAAGALASPSPLSVPAPAPPAAGPPAEAATVARSPGAGSGSAPTVVVVRRGGLALALGAASLAVGAAALLYAISQIRRSGSSPADTLPSALPAGASAAKSAPTGASAPASVSIREAAIPGPAPSPAPSAPPPSREAAPTATRAAAAPPALPPPEPGPSAASPAPESIAGIVFDNVYRTRRGAKFQISPDQARLTVDGRYVGVADDWDDHGGGKIFPFSAPGVHVAIARLPGYRDLTLEIVVTPSADHDAVSIGDELKRISREPYPKVPKVNEAVSRGVWFDPRLAGADVSLDGRDLGLASQFTSAHPLSLTGPAMHEVVLSEAGKSARVRVLCASTAEDADARVKAKLK